MDISKRKLKTTRFQLLITLLAIVMLSAYILNNAISKNIQSLSCYHTIFSDHGQLNTAIDTYSCKAVNDISAAVNNSNNAETLAVLRPLAREGSSLALRLILQLDGTLTEDSQVVALWQEEQNLEEILKFAEINLRNGDQMAANEAYQLARLLEPYSATLSLTQYLMEEKEDAYAAADIWHNALTSYPEAFSYAERRIGKARIEAGHGNLVEAVSEYRQFINEIPDNNLIRAAYYELAWVYRGMGEMQNAISTIEEALRLDNSWPETWQVHQRAGEIYEAADFTNEAISAYHQALSLNENASNASAALRRLESR